MNRRPRCLSFATVSMLTCFLPSPRWDVLSRRAGAASGSLSGTLRSCSFLLRLHISPRVSIAFRVAGSAPRTLVPPPVLEEEEKTFLEPCSSGGGEDRDDMGWGRAAFPNESPHYQVTDEIHGSVGQKGVGGESQWRVKSRSPINATPLPPPSPPPHLPPGPGKGEAGGQGAFAFIWAL